MDPTMDWYADYKLTKNIPHDVYSAIAIDRPDMAVTGQNVLVSGGGTGIGLATAKAFAQAGAKNVIITGRRPEMLETAVGEIKAVSPKTTVSSIVADIASLASVESLWKEVAEKVGKIDVLINNAGKATGRAAIGGGKVDDWWSIQQTNLFGTYAMTDAYVASLSASGIDEPGTLINVSSMISMKNYPGTSSYAVSKFGVAKITQFVHAESPKIRAFSVHPGIVLTDMSAGRGMPTLDTLELAAAFNLYLASPRADYLRGRFVTANWDVDELESHKEQIEAGTLLRVGLYADFGPDGQPW